MPIWLTVIGIAALIVLFIVKKMPKIRALAALFVGLGIAYGSTRSLVTRFTDDGAHAALAGGGRLAETAFGIGAASLGAIVVLCLLFLVAHDLYPRHSAKMRTTIAALLLPVFAVNAGGAVQHAIDTVRTGVVQTTNSQGR